MDKPDVRTASGKIIGMSRIDATELTAWKIIKTPKTERNIVGQPEETINQSAG